MREPDLLAGWRIVRTADPVELVLHDASGAVAGRVRPGPPSSPPAAVALRLSRLQARYHAIVHESWVRSMRIPDHQRALLELPDGSTTTLRNGTARGPLRRSMDVRLRLAGRRYRYAHTSMQTADIRRDGTTIVAAFTGSAARPDGARRSGATGVDLDVRATLDALDHLAVAIYLGLCGPPGRPGAVRRIASALWSELNNP